MTIDRSMGYSSLIRKSVRAIERFSPLQFVIKLLFVEVVVSVISEVSVVASGRKVVVVVRVSLLIGKLT